MREIYRSSAYSIVKIPLQAPQPADGWPGIRDATKPGATSPSVDFLSGGTKILSDNNEDCLFVNIFTKNKPQAGQKYPVLVWIHGGGYTFGNGNKASATPDYFMAHDVILVTLNYRLGALGNLHSLFYVIRYDEKASEVNKNFSRFFKS